MKVELIVNLAWLVAGLYAWYCLVAPTIRKGKEWAKRNQGKGH